MANITDHPSDHLTVKSPSSKWHCHEFPPKDIWPTLLEHCWSRGWTNNNNNNNNNSLSILYVGDEHSIPQNCSWKFEIWGNLEDIAQVLEPIVEASNELAKDKHANYVVQCILQRGRLQDKIRIVEAKPWFASEVMCVFFVCLVFVSLCEREGFLVVSISEGWLWMSSDGYVLSRDYEFDRSHATSNTVPEVEFSTEKCVVTIPKQSKCKNVWEIVREKSWEIKLRGNCVNHLLLTRWF